MSADGVFTHSLEEGYPPLQQEHPAQQKYSFQPGLQYQEELDLSSEFDLTTYEQGLAPTEDYHKYFPDLAEQSAVSSNDAATRVHTDGFQDQSILDSDFVAAPQAANTIFDNPFMANAGDLLPNAQEPVDTTDGLPEGAWEQELRTQIALSSQGSTSFNDSTSSGSVRSSGAAEEQRLQQPTIGALNLVQPDSSLSQQGPDLRIPNHSALRQQTADFDQPSMELGLSTASMYTSPPTQGPEIQQPELWWDPLQNAQYGQVPAHMYMGLSPLVPVQPSQQLRQPVQTQQNMLQQASQQAQPRTRSPILQDFDLDVPQSQILTNHRNKHVLRKMDHGELREAAEALKPFLRREDQRKLDNRRNKRTQREKERRQKTEKTEKIEKLEKELKEGREALEEGWKALEEGTKALEKGRKALEEAKEPLLAEEALKRATEGQEPKALFEAPRSESGVRRTQKRPRSALFAPYPGGS